MRSENRKYSVKTAISYDSYYYNPPLALFYGDKQVSIIGAGNSDYIRLFRDGDDVVVYCDNDSLFYMAIEVIDADGDKIGDTFIDNDYDYNELAGLQPINRAKAMLNYYL